MVLALGGFAFSAYLTYRELFSIHAVCEWCASSAVVMTLLAALSTWRFLTAASDASPPALAQDGRPHGEPPARLHTPVS
jgi:hypothetical protein